MKRLTTILATLGLVLLTACGTTPQDTPGTTTTEAPQATGTTTVFAAASLNQAFPRAAEGEDVSFSFDGSSGLVDQIVGGAPADVFASADQRNMDKAVEAGVIDGEPVMFATNYLVLVVPTGNPGEVTGFNDSLDDTRLVVCAPEVPCGGATERVAETAELTLEPVYEESNVTDVLGKVTSGEADAGIVYATDATQAGDTVEVLDIPGAQEDPNTYWIAAVTDAPNPAGAEEFVTMITGETGQKALAEFGFGPPQ